MDIPALIQRCRIDAGLTQRELSVRAGTSQPAIASYESGRLSPRLDTLVRVIAAAGYDVEMHVRPRVRRGAAEIERVARELRAIILAEGARGAWRRLLDFVDDFRSSAPPGKRWLVAAEPGPTGDLRLDAALAGLTELLCNEAGMAYPAWTDTPGREAKPWWFVADLPGYEAVALRDSPIELKRHGVFVTREALERA